MIAGYPAQPTVDQGLMRTIFGGVGLPAATNILQTRGISYIGINEPNNAIVIFTQRKLSVAEHKLLANASTRVNNERIRIEFVHGNVAQNGPNPPAPPMVLPYTPHNGRYTCGSSIYIGSEKGAGTLGCLVRDPDGTLYGLSNNHVTGGSNYGVPGLPIVAPGMADVAAGGEDPQTIGHHQTAYPFIDGFPGIVDATENLDAAIFTIANPDRVSSMQRNFHDTPAITAPLAVGITVQKVGRSSAQTTGAVIAELFDFEPIGYIIDIIKGHKHVWFKSLFVVKSTFGLFSYSGDSGSLITTTNPDGDRVAVGLVVGATPEGNTLCLSINRILTYFNVTLVSGHNV